MARSYRIDTSDLERLARDFKAATPAVRREYRKSLKDAGRIVADDARRRIEPVSPPTAASIKVGTRGVDRVIIRTGKDRRIAALLEGNGHPGSWRHPLFGDREHWYRQRTHPYMHPAWEAKKRAARRRLARAVRNGLRTVGIREE